MSIYHWKLGDIALAKVCKKVYAKVQVVKNEDGLFYDDKVLGISTNDDGSIDVTYQLCYHVETIRTNQRLWLPYTSLHLAERSRPFYGTDKPSTKHKTEPDNPETDPCENGAEQNSSENDELDNRRELDQSVEESEQYVRESEQCVQMGKDMYFDYLCSLIENTQENKQRDAKESKESNKENAKIGEENPKEENKELDTEKIIESSMEEIKDWDEKYSIERNAEHNEVRIADKNEENDTVEYKKDNKYALENKVRYADEIEARNAEKNLKKSSQESRKENSEENKKTDGEENRARVADLIINGNMKEDKHLILEVCKENNVVVIKEKYAESKERYEVQKNYRSAEECKNKDSEDNYKQGYAEDNEDLHAMISKESCDENNKEMHVEDNNERYTENKNIYVEENEERHTEDTKESHVEDSEDRHAVNTNKKQAENPTESHAENETKSYVENNKKHAKDTKERYAEDNKNKLSEDNKERHKEDTKKSIAEDSNKQLSEDSKERNTEDTEEKISEDNKETHTEDTKKQLSEENKERHKEKHDKDNNEGHAENNKQNHTEDNMEMGTEKFTENDKNEIKSEEDKERYILKDNKERDSVVNKEIVANENKEWNAEKNEAVLDYLKRPDADLGKKYEIVYTRDNLTEKELEDYFFKCFRYKAIQEQADEELSSSEGEMNFEWEGSVTDDSNESSDLEGDRNYSDTEEVYLDPPPKPTVHATWCLVCGKEGSLIECPRCSSSYHPACKEKWLVTLFHRKEQTELRISNNYACKMTSDTHTVRSMEEVKKDTDQSLEEISEAKEETDEAENETKKVKKATGHSEKEIKKVKEDTDQSLEEISKAKEDTDQAEKETKKVKKATGHSEKEVEKVKADTNQSVEEADKIKAETDLCYCPSCTWGPRIGYNDIVWHKFGGCPWWPARVLARSAAPPCIAYRAHHRGQVPLRYYGTLEHSWASLGRMCLFLPWHVEGRRAGDPELRQAYYDACDDYIAVYLT